MRKTKPSKTPAVLIHDGARWLLPGEPGRAVAAPPDAPPPALLAAVSGHASLRFLLAGEVRRVDAALPPGARWAEAQALVAQEAADQTGADPATLLCAGQAYGEGRAAALLAGVFPMGRAEALRAAAEGAGLRFGGVASLELACLAAWRGRPAAGGAAVALVGQGGTLVAAPPPAAPVPVAGGLRHAAADPAVWLARFTQGARFLDAAAPLRLVVFAEADPGLAGALRAQGGFADVAEAPCDALFAEAARLAAEARPNRLGGALPVANPWEPRKRFSHGWIVAPCAALLALPFLYGGAQDWLMAREEARYRAAAEAFLPLERAVKAAEAREGAARRALEGERAEQTALAARRRPLAAFVQTAYFFCRHAGPSVRLEALAERDGLVTARGVYADPEDGVRLNADLAAFAGREGLRVARTVVSEGKDAEGLPLSRFEIAVDGSRLGEAGR